VIATILAAALLAIAPSNTSPPPGRCQTSEAANHRLVLNFYRRALIDKDVRGAFEAFMTPGFIEHKPDVVDGGREGTIRFLQGVVAELPKARWRVIRSMADGDMVVVHASFEPSAGAPAYAIADFFRVASCRIVEHWDVVAPPSKATGNPNSRF
jgi:predicted SnoaL-like aldol condensation-catalyzing enzyme